MAGAAGLAPTNRRAGSRAPGRAVGCRARDGWPVGSSASISRRAPGRARVALSASTKGRVAVGSSASTSRRAPGAGRCQAVEQAAVACGSSRLRAVVCRPSSTRCGRRAVVLLLIARWDYGAGGPPPVGPSDIGQSLGRSRIAAAEPPDECASLSLLVRRERYGQCCVNFLRAESSLRELAKALDGCCAISSAHGRSFRSASRRRMSSRSLGRAPSRFVRIKSSIEGIDTVTPGQVRRRADDSRGRRRRRVLLHPS